MVNCDMVNGLDCNMSNNFDIYVNCCDGKIHRTEFPTSSSRSTMLFELVHSDVCGKITPQSSGVSNYFVDFIDDSTRHCWIYGLKSKDEVFAHFVQWQILVENQFSTKVEKLRTDNGAR